MTGEGPAFRERKRERIVCGDCGKEVAAGLLDFHHMTQHGKAREKRWTWTDTATGGGRGRATDIPARVLQGGGKGVYSGRVPGEGRETDGDARALLEEARAGHHYHLGGGKPPPPQMRKL